MASASSYQTMSAPQQLPLGSLADVSGQFNGGHYTIDHRDTNTILSVTLAPNAPFYAQPGANA